MNKRTDDILNSLDGVTRASAPVYFYSKLRTRMERQLVPATEKGWALRPVYAIIALFVVLLINAAVLFRDSNVQTPSNLANASDTDSMQSLASEYRVNDAGSIYDLNQDK
jgi:hypothetical protein